MSGSNAFYIYHLTHLAISIIIDFEWLSTFTFTSFQRIQSMTSWNIIVNSGLMEIFLQNFICLKTMLQILLKSGRLGLVCIVSRVENQFTMSLMNSKLILPDAACFKTSWQSHPSRKQNKVQWLNSKINFVEKGKQPCS